MKKIVNIFVVTLVSLFSISCSNMTIGFEEDSPLYNGPLIDTREDVNTTQDSKTDTNVDSEKKTENSVLEESAESPKETSSQESDTTFTYERDDE